MVGVSWTRPSQMWVRMSLGVQMGWRMVGRTTTYTRRGTGASAVAYGLRVQRLCLVVWIRVVVVVEDQAGRLSRPHGHGSTTRRRRVQGGVVASDSRLVVHLHHGHGFLTGALEWDRHAKLYLDSDTRERVEAVVSCLYLDPQHGHALVMFLFLFSG